MAGFVAADAVEPLDYDFTAFVDAKGTVREPSRKQRRRFDRRVAGIFGDETTDETNERFAKMSATERQHELERIADESIEALVELCGDQPSREELEALPERILAAFVSYLRGTLLANPTT